jgi:MFS family permease
MGTGWVVDRYGVKYPYAICFLLWSAAIALTGTVDTLGALIMMRLLIGATEAVVVPATYRYIRDNFDESWNGTTTGLTTLGNKFGPAIGAPVAAYLIVHYDWRMMFFVTGAAGLVWLVPWLLTARNDLPKGTAAMAARKKEAGTVTLAAILRSPLIWGSLILNFCYGYFTFFCATWMPAYLVEAHGLSLQRSALFTFFSFAGIAIMGLVAGNLADQIIRRGGDPVKTRKIFITIGFLGATTVLLGATASTLNAALFWNVASLTLLGFTTANTLALCRLTLIPKPAIGLATGVSQVATSLAGGASASISGWLLQVSGGYTVPMFVIFVFLLIGAATTWLLLKPEYAPKVTPLPGAGLEVA